MNLTWRGLREADLSACFAFEPKNVGADTIGHEAAFRVWQQLLADGHLAGAVIESGPEDGSELVAVGARVFVTLPFAEAEVDRPRSGLNQRVIESVSHGHSVVLPHSEIGAGNAGPGLAVVNLIASWQPERWNAAAIVHINGLLAESFLEVHRGHRLRCVLREIVGRTDQALVVQSSGIFRVIGRWSDEGRLLVVLTREDALAVPYSIANQMFRYETPRLRLNGSEQRLLTAALRMSTDAAIAAALDMSPQVVKKRWRSIFSKAESVVVGIFADECETGTRGKQKRHHVLAYVNAHPEELRPFAYRTRASSRRRRTS